MQCKFTNKIELLWKNKIQIKKLFIQLFRDKIISYYQLKNKLRKKQKKLNKIIQINLLKIKIFRKINLSIFKKEIKKMLRI